MLLDAAALVPSQNRHAAALRIQNTHLLFPLSQVLLDAAAFVPSQPLNLAETPADFVSVSFYKMFGYPTGLGALIIRTENVDILDKVFFGGGSVSIASSETDFHELQCKPSSKLEDGTIPFLDIIALKVPSFPCYIITLLHCYIVLPRALSFRSAENRMLPQLCRRGLCACTFGGRHHSG